MQFYSCCNFPRQRGQQNTGMEGEVFFPLQIKYRHKTSPVSAHTRRGVGQHLQAALSTFSGTRVASKFLFFLLTGFRSGCFPPFFISLNAKRLFSKALGFLPLLSVIHPVCYKYTLPAPTSLSSKKEFSISSSTIVRATAFPAPILVSGDRVLTPGCPCCPRREPSRAGTAAR